MVYKILIKFDWTFIFKLKWYYTNCVLLYCLILADMVDFPFIYFYNIYKQDAIDVRIHITKKLQQKRINIIYGSVVTKKGLRK